MKIILDELVTSLKHLSGVGQKTAERYAYEFLDMEQSKRDLFINELSNLKKIKKCSNCNNYSYEEICDYCKDENRDSQKLVIVEKARNIDKIEMIIPNTFYYLVLGGVIDPLIGINTDDLFLEKMFDRIEKEKIKELILVLPSTSEGELTASYIKKKLEKSQTRVSKLAQGIPMGSSLEYLDEITLLKSLNQRQDY